MYLKKIKTHTVLSKLVRERCEEHGVCVLVDERIENEHFVVLKVDDFYNSLNVKIRPKSPDCLIIQKCNQSDYALTVAELKDISQASRFELKHIYEKFETCFDDFIGKRFDDILKIEFKRVKLYFVSKIEIYKRDATLKLKLANKPFYYNGKKYYIEPQMPSPAIKPCY